ncbi:stage II sporulation protein M [Fontibacillus sp. BL9]|uniref:stage II sporulation protein M n=1 Tax=Fontibacillus sp. BL9 TaxID=3389971 RepID=UPI00397C3A3A
MNMLSLRRFFLDLSRYKKMMWISLLLFTIGILLGAAGSESIARLVEPQLESLRGYSRQLSQSPVPELSFFKFIFLNNAVKSVAVILLGALLGLFPAIFLLMNGMVLGLVVSLAASQGENLFELIVLGLLPHGIIEIPAILIASAFGLQFGYLVLKGVGELGARDRGDRTVKWGEFLTSAGRGAFWIVVFLLVAAVIESTVTYHLVR